MVELQVHSGCNLSKWYGLSEMQLLICVESGTYVVYNRSNFLDEVMSWR